MLEKKISRRNMLRATGLAVLGSTFAGLASCAPKKKEEPSPEASSSKRPFRVCLNVSTIAGYKLPVQKQIDLCAEAGFEGIELWTRDVDAFVKQGGTYETPRRQLEGSGLLLENMIGFASWFADDPSKRKEGLNQMRHDMEMVAGLGGKFIAAPAQGVTQLDRTRLPEYSERYRAILDLGDEMGVTPILELWGDGVLNQLSDTMAIAIASGHSLRDSDRVFPGDGICPFNKVLPLLYDSGFRGGLSVELFNKRYWETMDVKEVLKKSFEKTTQVINSSMG